jgi:hypothetical protein
VVCSTAAALSVIQKRREERSAVLNDAPISFRFQSQRQMVTVSMPSAIEVKTATTMHFQPCALPLQLFVEHRCFPPMRIANVFSV